MPEKKEEHFSINIQWPLATTKALIGKQSIRATFRLSYACIGHSDLAADLDIKQKSLFDQLLVDETALSMIAEILGDIDFDHTSGIQKTYLISRRALDLLDPSPIPIMYRVAPS